MSKVLIADLFSPAGIARLRAAGHDVIYNDKLNGETLLQTISTEKPKVLIVRSKKVTADMLAATGSLELVVRAGAGYDNIDVREASRRGIFVANCPGKNAAAVAELTMGLILSIDRQIPECVQELRVNGTWDKGRFCEAEGIMGKTIGLIGWGNIAQEVAKRAKSFGLNVVAYSRSLRDDIAERSGVRKAASLHALAAESDIVSVHVAYTPDTKNMINDAFLAHMKNGSVLINTSRGEVVDEAALLRAIEEKNIRAGLDVFVGEPSVKKGPFEHPLARHPNVVSTHHIGASTKQAEAAIGDEAVRIVLKFCEVGEVPNCVNMASLSPATHLLTVRHLDRVGVLAHVLNICRQAEWNVQEMENLVFQGAEAACARIRFTGSVSTQEEFIQGMLNNENVLAVSIVTLSQPSPMFMYTQRPGDKPLPVSI
eukprot:GILI01006615.1.p1 GENE.GILI01006615.1~~GILI01006615.1.p1  ORF type:complete len:453 (-),score=147.41 GILI01006615.1:459-1739(-)